MADATPPAGGETYRAGLPMLGARLLAAAELVRPGRAVADIGCDHGKLAVWLAQTGKSPRVVAVDIHPLPLARARALVRQTGLAGRVDVRLGDGMAPLAPGEVQDVVMAGFGGEAMAAVLAACPFTRDAALHYVLLPATRAHCLRRWLCENGFALRCEVPVEENGRFYAALSAVYTGRAFSPPALFCETGLVPQAGGPAAAGYLAAQHRRIAKRGRAPLAPGERRALDALLAGVRAQLEEAETQAAAAPPGGGKDGAETCL